jgi:hypothetical protein
MTTMKQNVTQKIMLAVAAAAVIVGVTVAIATSGGHS